ncbi:acetyl-CoA acetyltransferase [Citromicrobium sp. RCC1885]|uniref:thiolase family protein n=1 Tax=unclassified Citromicrobium TaxID=2630544 RepID=UPI0006C92779|nr:MULTISPECIES: thiolase family protein [unclassified Citromicrobium]KPM22592.1 acetyl-CoA acetyltransferase [Citromicrobium sp. RCC1885]KPM26075.1 acetyl-CoA acetyltransferase [Citromicrobium sp. RCC1878]OAM07837.1 acetyl-CoA acetyltransferase [Citromicrobium sp. RCC1897]|tara:strand:+ start:328 stop:1473 length:1146 start_codon:yes stop_codon:yes gene_type:complete
MSDVCIIGVGIHPFGRTDGVEGIDQGVFAVREALKDAGVEWPDIQFAYGSSDAAGNPDTMVERLGLTGVQFINVRNGCAAGGSALFSAQMAIKSDDFDLGIAVGFDKHPRGAFDAKPAEYGLPDWYGEAGYMVTTQFFAMKIMRYMELHGISRDSLGRVAEKAFRNGAHAPHAWRREPIDLETILQAPMISDPYSKYMFCSPAEGGVALILASERKARELGCKPIRLKAATMRTRPPGSFEVFAPSIDIERGGTATALASAAAFEAAGIGPDEIDIAQLQDTEAGAEIMHMAENGFCADGEQEAWLAEGATAIDGRLPVNTDGGCIACGEPIGASGLRQVYENVIQLRGDAGARQVPGDPKTAYSHVYGAPGVSAVTILER